MNIFSSLFERVKPWVISILLIPVCYYLISHIGEYTWIDNADLVIHEGGHVIFMIFGRFIYAAGGTLMQIILPSLIAIYFFKNYYRTGTQIGLLWLGQNLINISVYAADAQARKLHLLGGSKVHHDWHFMLSELNILSYDKQVSYVFITLAVIVFVLAILMPLIIREY